MRPEVGRNIAYPQTPPRSGVVAVVFDDPSQGLSVLAIPTMVFLGNACAVIVWTVVQETGQAAVGSSVARFERDGPAHRGDCFLELSQGLKSTAQVVMGFRKVGLQ